MTTTAAETEAATKAALRASSTKALLRNAYALTHQMKGATSARRADLRAQRDLIDAEVIRRTAGAAVTSQAEPLRYCTYHEFVHSDTRHESAVCKIELRAVRD